MRNRQEWQCTGHVTVTGEDVTDNVVGTETLESSENEKQKTKTQCCSR